MMKKAVMKLSKPKVLFVNFILFSAVLLCANTLIPHSFHFLTQTFNYSPRQAYDLLSVIGEGGRQTHFNVLFADIIMVILYSGFLIGANYATFGRFVKRCNVISIITFFPLLLALIQILEIIGLFIVIIRYPAEMYPLIEIINIITIIKYLLTVICFLLPIAGLCCIIIKKIKEKSWWQQRNGKRKVQP
jgi:hypothetical protein